VGLPQPCKRHAEQTLIFMLNHSFCNACWDSSTRKERQQRQEPPTPKTLSGRLRWVSNRWEKPNGVIYLIPRHENIWSESSSSPLCAEVACSMRFENCGRISVNHFHTILPNEIANNSIVDIIDKPWPWPSLHQRYSAVVWIEGQLYSGRGRRRCAEEFLVA